MKYSFAWIRKWCKNEGKPTRHDDLDTVLSIDLHNYILMIHIFINNYFYFVDLGTYSWMGHVWRKTCNFCKYYCSTNTWQLRPIFSSTFRRKKVELLSSRQRLGRLSFRLSFLSESISQKLSKVSIWILEYLFTIKRGTNYNKADDPVICISRVICPCFDIVHRN